MQTANSWTRADAKNNFLYNQGSELNSESGLYDLPYRNYDASLGRFFQVDPMAHADHTTSPFAYGGNNPVMMNDPSGLMVDYTNSVANPDYVYRKQAEAEARAQLWALLDSWAQDAGKPGGGGASGMDNMWSDAADVRWGRMSIEEYTAKYGGITITGSDDGKAITITSWNGESGLTDPTGSNISLGDWIDREGIEDGGIDSDGAVVVKGKRSVYVSFQVGQTQGGGPADPPSKEYEFNFNFTFGPQVGFQIGHLLNLDLRLWTFGAISSKDDLKDKEFHDGKLTSQHSFSFSLLGAGFGKGFEHKIEYGGANEGFKSSDFTWLDFFVGTTTKTDPLGNVISKEQSNTIFGVSPLFFSFEITKDPK